MFSKMKNTKYKIFYLYLYLCSAMEVRNGCEMPVYHSNLDSDPDSD
jgi:hypothetical protein